MRHQPGLKVLGILGVAMVPALLWTGTVLAGSSANYAINWQVFGDGGQPIANAGQTVTLNGTLGQPVSGISSATGLTLSAGYWTSDVSAITTGSQLFLPIIFK